MCSCGAAVASLFFAYLGGFSQLCCTGRGSDRGVSDSLIVVLGAARGLESSGRGSLHGHWEIWGVSLTMQSAIEQFA